jgi:hypothetical protein
MNVVHLCDCMEFMKGVPDNYYELAIVDTYSEYHNGIRKVIDRWDSQKGKK